MWYLAVLAWLRLLAQLTPSRLWGQIITVVLGLGLGYINLLGNLPFGIGICPTAFVLFLTGNFIRNIEEKVNLPKVTKFLPLTLLIINILLSQCNDRISVYGIYFGRYEIAIIVGISGVLGLYLLVKFFYATGNHFCFFEKVGKYSLNIMCTHYFLLRAMSALTMNLCGNYDMWHSAGLVKAIICTGVVLLIEYLIIAALRALKVPSSSVFKL